MRRDGRPWGGGGARTAVAALAAIALLGACGAPVRVRRADPHTVERELTRSILTGAQVSGPTHNVLHRFGLTEAFDDDPERVLTQLHQAVVGGHPDPDVVFALAELSFAHAESTRQSPHFLASAVYAYAFLFPVDRSAVPLRFDPRVRLASDLYNRGLTEGLETAGGRVAIEPGVHPLPFGELEIAFDRSQLRWGDRQLVDFVPAAELEVEGLNERYRRSGLGVPLAAATVPIDPGGEADTFVAKRARVPMSAVLRIPESTTQIATGHVGGELSLYDAQVTETVRIGDRDVPLEVEPTAAMAYMLSEARPWEAELRGFFGGALPGSTPARMLAVQPYRRGRIPVVFVHGTASSVARWADMVNDLSNDPRIRGHFQFWFFTYDTGNPILFTADSLREMLRTAVARLDPDGTDPALRQMVVIGHSQGGLLAKTTAIDSGDRFYPAKTPFEQLRLRDDTRAYLRRVIFLQPLPFVRRVIFIATPHRGSYVAGSWLAHRVARFITMPARMLEVTADVVSGNAELASFRMPSAVDNMTPTNRFVKTLTEIPVAPGIVSNSIVAVQGDGPVEDGDDGVVKYTSAHRTDVESEIVVRSAHSCQSNPATIAEVRRILLLQLAAFQQETAPPADARAAATPVAPAAGASTP